MGIRCEGREEEQGVQVFREDNDDVAWYASNSKSMTQEVGTKLPNELGLYGYEW